MFEATTIAAMAKMPGRWVRVIFIFRFGKGAATWPAGCKRAVLRPLRAVVQAALSVGPQLIFHQMTTLQAKEIIVRHHCQDRCTCRVLPKAESLKVAMCTRLGA